MGDLISRKALLVDLCEDREEGIFEFTDAQAEAADKIIRYVNSRIEKLPSVPAVPLDKLCEWLSTVTAEAPCSDDCEGCEAFTGDGDISVCWKKAIKEWMEEQDAKEET